jgi:hypothetical protein
LQDDATRRPGLAEAISFAALVVLVGLLLVAVGQPLYTDDTWWHLALGRAYAQAGPWLVGDPLLFTAPGPPAPASWLADLALYATETFGGFTALRALHVATVAGIVALGWSLLARASGSRLLANLGSAVFICLAAYRLIQLRPHLFTILATLLLYRLLFEKTAAPSVRQVTAAVALLAVWVNMHAAFVLGPILIAVALTGIVLTETLKPAGERDLASTRIRRLAAALVLGTAATCLNPAGIEPHQAYLIAGAESPALERVGDEWSSIDLFSLPELGALPSPLAWFALWMLLVGCLTILIRGLLRCRRMGPIAFQQLELMTLGLACLGFAASIAAVRFLWLLMLPLLFLGTWRAQNASRPVHKGRNPIARWSAVTAVVLLIPAFLLVGDWPIVSRGVPSNWQDYKEDYRPDKYHAQAVWLLDDAGLAGNLFAEYYLGGFLGYWLAPELRTFVNGSLNVSMDAIDANLPIRERRGANPEEGFLELLDRQRIDVFMGIRLPRLGPTARPWFVTATHLEGEPDWLLIFRNLTSAVYLRSSERNQRNLEHVVDYYREQGIEFDTLRGFDPEAVITRSQTWAINHGLVPTYFPKLLELANDQSSQQNFQSLGLISSVYSALGLYPQSIEIDRKLIGLRPNDLAPQRRLTWCLLRSNQYAEARIAAQSLAFHDPSGALSKRIVATARATETSMPKRDLKALIVRLPLFTTLEAIRLGAGMAGPEIRSR